MYLMITKNKYMEKSILKIQNEEGKEIAKASLDSDFIAKILKAFSTCETIPVKINDIVDEGELNKVSCEIENETNGLALTIVVNKIKYTITDCIEYIIDIDDEKETLILEGEECKG